MKQRLNGSHLRKHNITISEYIEKYPESYVGSYPKIQFKCQLCSLEINNSASSISKHIKIHGFTNIDEYNQIYNIKYCKCGCGNKTTYSFSRHQFNDFTDGHSTIWNKGINKLNHPEIYANINSGGWNRGLTKITNDSINIQSLKLLEKYKNGEIDIVKRQNKYINTCRLKYGVDNIFQTDTFKEHCKKESLIKYGCEYPMQHESVFLKSAINSAKTKIYKTNSGLLWNIKGYEDLALDILLEIYNENDIKIGSDINYKFYYYVDNKKHRYYPDIQINNLIIEVKSYYTLKKDTYIKYKRQSVLDLGLEYELWIFNNRREKILKQIKGDLNGIA